MCVSSARSRALKTFAVSAPARSCYERQPAEALTHPQWRACMRWNRSHCLLPVQPTSPYTHCRGGTYSRQQADLCQMLVPCSVVDD